MSVKDLEMPAYTLAGIGALNWGLKALFDLDLVASLLPEFAFYIYVTIGVAGAYVVYDLYEDRFM